MNRSLADYLTTTKLRIDREISEFLPTKHDNPDIAQFYRLMRDYPLRSGKRLRPILCLLMCEAFGKSPELAIDTAIALELLQSWLLIHDDIEDGSFLRRGLECLHRKHGIPLAINVGDGLHSKMWEMVNRNVANLGYERSFRIFSEFVQLSNKVVEGQHIELSWVQEKRWKLSEVDYWEMVVRKTAWYTCISPCRLGAMIGGANEPQLDRLSEIGTDLGVAFQMQDDILNLSGDVKIYGKEIAGDLIEGKRTLILIELLNSCSESEAKRVIELMDKPRAEKENSELDEILSLMEKYKSIEKTRHRKVELAEKARNCLDELFSELPENHAQKLIFQLIEFIIDRDC